MSSCRHGASARAGGHRASIRATVSGRALGTAREVGTKFGRWLDLTMMRLPV